MTAKNGENKRERITERERICGKSRRKFTEGKIRLDEMGVEKMRYYERLDERR